MQYLSLLRRLLWWYVQREKILLLTHCHEWARYETSFVEALTFVGASMEEIDEAEAKGYTAGIVLPSAQVASARTRTSILVHELVHHLNRKVGLKHGLVDEFLAYTVQYIVLRPDRRGFCQFLKEGLAWSL